MGTQHVGRAQWLRGTSSRDLHAIASRFCRDQQTRDLSRSQEWLLERIFDELEQRRKDCYPKWRSCSCRFCLPPFTYEDVDAASLPSYQA